MAVLIYERYFTYTSMHIYIYIYTCVPVCMCNDIFSISYVSRLLLNKCLFNLVSFHQSQARNLYHLLVRFISVILKVMASYSLVLSGFMLF